MLEMGRKLKDKKTASNRTFEKLADLPPTEINTTALSQEMPLQEDFLSTATRNKNQPWDTENTLLQNSLSQRRGSLPDIWSVSRGLTSSTGLPAGEMRRSSARPLPKDIFAPWGTPSAAPHAHSAGAAVTSTACLATSAPPVPVETDTSSAQLAALDLLELHANAQPITTREGEPASLAPPLNGSVIQAVTQALSPAPATLMPAVSEQTLAPAKTQSSPQLQLQTPDFSPTQLICSPAAHSPQIARDLAVTLIDSLTREEITSLLKQKVLITKVTAETPELLSPSTATISSLSPRTETLQPNLSEALTRNTNYENDAPQPSAVHEILKAIHQARIYIMKDLENKLEDSLAPIKTTLVDLQGTTSPLQEASRRFGRHLHLLRHFMCHRLLPYRNLVLPGAEAEKVSQLRCNVWITELG